MKILVTKRWLRKNFKSPSFCERYVKNLNLSTDNFFDVNFQENVLVSLLLFSYVCYQVHLSDIQLIEIATSMGSSFKNTWSLYLNFSYMTNRYRNFWFMTNSKCINFNFEEIRHQKRHIFQCFKGLLFCNGQPYQNECWHLFRVIC